MIFSLLELNIMTMIRLVKVAVAKIQREYVNVRIWPFLMSGAK